MLYSCYDVAPSPSPVHLSLIHIWAMHALHTSPAAFDSCACTQNMHTIHISWHRIVVVRRARSHETCTQRQNRVTHSLAGVVHIANFRKEVFMQRLHACTMNKATRWYDSSAAALFSRDAVTFVLADWLAARPACLYVRSVWEMHTHTECL